MKLLVIGGAGLVGGLVLPAVAERHALRVFDRQPPADPGWEYVAGDVGDLEALVAAAAGCDALLYMAMGHKIYDTTLGITSNFDVNVKGVYLALDAVQRNGIRHAVYTSSMSVYEHNLEDRPLQGEDLPPDARGLYGLTKRLGEEVCRNAAQTWCMSINALRLYLPMADDEWQAFAQAHQPTFATTANDVARAILAALEYRDGFQAFTITGDYAEQHMLMEKARRLLGWQPLARLRANDD